MVTAMFDPVLLLAMSFGVDRALFGSLSVINTNYALEAGLNPAKDALIIEDAKSPYVNFLVARPDNKDSDAIQKLSKALTSPEVKAFIEKKYNGAVVPAF
jgi:D-methionine transport system substrate-binding protein